MAWHDSFDRMKQRPHILVCCPQAVCPAWGKVVAGLAAGKFSPWDHQYRFVEWFRDRHAGLLAADMGTGKTLAALLALVAMRHRPGLVHVDLSSGTSKQRAARLEAAVASASGTTLVVTVNYEAAWRKDLAKVIDAVKWSALVLDESHRIKAPRGTASLYLARLAAKHQHARRLCLTGTPMPHSPLDLFGQCRFLDPQLFGTSFVAMRSRYADTHPKFPSMVKSWKRQDELTAKLDSIAWRVTADEVLDLPDTIHEVIEVELSAATLRFYDRMETQMTAEIASGTVTAGNALVKLLRLQQATGGFCRVDDGVVVAIDGTPAKQAALADRLADLPDTEPVVVFCRFRTDLEAVAAVARQLGREYAEVSGERKDLDRWQRGDAVILGVQMQSGGVGIDCTRAAYAFYYSLGFSLGDYEQSLARLRRPGQERCCRYYHLVAPGTVDEQVYDALRERRDVVGSVMDSLSQRQEAVA